VSAEQAAPSYRRQTRPPPWRDVRVLRVAGQALFLVLIAWALWFLFTTLLTNLRALSLPTSFDYLEQPTRVDIRDTDFNPSQPVKDALAVGLLNTVRVAAVGIVIATVLGTVIGIARLSRNWLVRRAAALYVELLRNVPVLVIIIFLYTAVMLRLPPISEALEIAGLVVFSNRGLNVPWGDGVGNVGAFTVALLVVAALAIAVARWRTRRSDATGEPSHGFLYGLGVLVAGVVVAYFALGQPVAFTAPVLDNRRVTGGIGLGPEYAALLFGLVLYTASHIAEIVRGSILAVPKGQTEAASAVGLTSWQRMRYVILPQSLRIAVPPLANQYLNLTKNSSLAVFIGYFDLTRITQQAIANGNPAPQAILVLMGCYLALSLTIALFSNMANRRLALKGSR